MSWSSIPGIGGFIPEENSRTYAHECSAIFFFFFPPVFVFCLLQVFTLIKLKQCRWEEVRYGVNNVHKDIDRMMAYEKALKTWARWVDSSVDPGKTKVFFQGVSPDHMR